jgi:hypothetical protein
MPGANRLPVSIQEQMLMKSLLQDEEIAQFR